MLQMVGDVILRDEIVERDYYTHGRTRRVHPKENAIVGTGGLGSNSDSATYWLCDFRQVFSASLLSFIKWVL